MVTQSRIRQQYLWDALWLALLSIYILGGVNSIPLHGDESTLIYMGRDYYFQLIQQDFSLVTYREDPISATDQHLRLLNGTIPKYLYGFTAYHSGYELNDINEQWEWGADWNYNLETGRIPNADLLSRTRFVSAIQLALSLIVLFVIGYQLGDRPVAYVSSFYYALNPAVLINGRRAMMESTMLLTGLLVVLAGLWLLQHRTWWLYLLLGFVGGLALSSKHTNAFILVPIFAVCALYSLFTDWKAKSPSNQLRHIVSVIGAGILMLMIFYVLNPAWWGDPIARVQEVLALRTDLLNGQVETFGGYTTFTDRLNGFVEQVLIVHPKYYEVSNWADYIGEAILTYESSLWRGVSIGGSAVGAIVVLIIILLGIWQLFRALTPRSGSHWLIGIWGAFIVITVALITPINWQRYYLPVYPVIALLLGLGVAQIWDWLHKKRTVMQESVSISTLES